MGVFLKRCNRAVCPNGGSTTRESYIGGQGLGWGDSAAQLVANGRVLAKMVGGGKRGLFLRSSFENEKGAAVVFEYTGVLKHQTRKHCRHFPDPKERRSSQGRATESGGEGQGPNRSAKVVKRQGGSGRKRGKKQALPSSGEKSDYSFGVEGPFHLIPIPERSKNNTGGRER